MSIVSYITLSHIPGEGAVGTGAPQDENCKFLGLIRGEL